VKAAALVRSGFTGRGDVLDPADRNFFDAVSPAMAPDMLFRDLGAFRILETDIKKYSVGFPIAAPIAALEEIMRQQPIEASAISEVRIRYPEEWYKVIGDENRMPDLSLRYCMAVTILDGALTFAASHDEKRMKAAEVIEVGRRITFLPADPGQDRFEARIEIDVAGNTFAARQGLQVRGRKENPMTVDEVHAKACELLEMVIAPAEARRVVELTHALAGEPDISRLVAATIPRGAG
jgi:2-methylcitrate dehydratase PrpD